MKLRTLLLFCFVSSVIGGLAQYVPPDFYGQTYMKAVGLWENKGQIVDTQGNKRDDIKFYSQGGFPRAYLRDKSRVSFTIAKVDTNIATVDTLYRLDMRPYGPNANDVTPLGWALKDWHQNFYLPHCGGSGVTDVLGHSRAYYENMFPKIDMHFYSGGVGQKMAIVMRPGCDINDLKLAFNGQDSIKVDFLGNLKLYYDGKYMVIPYVQAYQVDGNGTIIPVGWAANYQVNNGTGVVGFTWSSYNPAWPLVFQMGIPPLGGLQELEQPGLCWGTYMGGDVNDNIQSSTLDQFGNYYVSGVTDSSIDYFPAAPGTNYSTAGQVAFLVQFNNLNQIQWKTFFGGGLGSWTYGEDVIQKPDGLIYMVGTTISGELPVVPFGAAFFQPAPATPGLGVGYMGRFRITNGYREWATYFGSSQTALRCVAAMADKRLFIGGSTWNPLPPLDETAPSGSTSWPYEAGADGYLAMFNDDDRLQWTTFLPGNDYDEVRALDASATKLAIGGVTTSTDLMLANGGQNAYQVGTQGYSDGFLFEVNYNCEVKWGTYIGGPGFQEVPSNCVAIDPISKDIMIAGWTQGLVGLPGSSDLDVVPGPGWFQGTIPDGTGSGWIMRFSDVDRSRNWTTHLYDGPSSTAIRGICFDDAGNSYVVGDIHSNSDGLLIHSDPNLYNQNEIVLDFTDFDPYNDGSVLRFSASNELEWGTYLGGEGGPFGESINTVLRRPSGSYLQVAGSTSKHVDHVLSFFPLDDGGGVPYFSEVWAGGSSDAFIAAFCEELTVGIERAGHIDVPHLVWRGGNGDEGSILGLPSGAWPYAIHDAGGRLVAQGVAKATGNGPTPIHLPEIRDGFYTLSIQSKVLKFTKHL